MTEYTYVLSCYDFIFNACACYWRARAFRHNIEKKKCICEYVVVVVVAYNNSLGEHYVLIACILIFMQMFSFCFPLHFTALM